MTAKWMLQTKRADFDAISGKYGISPVTARIIRNREVKEDDAIPVSYTHLGPGRIDPVPGLKLA